MPAASFPGVPGLRAPTIFAVIAVALIVFAVGSGSAAASAADPTTSTVLTVSPTSVGPGDTVTSTATVTGIGGNPTGTVSFDSTNGAAGVAPLTAVPGSPTTSQATLATTSFPAGSFLITAQYRSDNTGLYFNSHSAQMPLSVSSTVFHNTTVILTSSPPVIVTGQPAILTAVVSRDDGTLPKPIGEVTFNDNGVLLNTVPLDGNGTASLTVSDFIGGAHSVVALYSGNATDRSSSSAPLTFQLAFPPTAVQTTTTVSAAPNHIVAGQSVVVSAHVIQTGHTTSPPAGESVLFYANGVLLGDAPLDASGNASRTVSGWLTNTYALTASYVGDLNNLPSTSDALPLAVIASAAPLTVTAPSATIAYGGAVPALTPAYAGFIGGDTAASLTTQATCATTATSLSSPGSYPVTCSGASSPLYAITYVNGSITVLAPTTASCTATKRGDHNGDDDDERGHRTSQCESLLANPSPDAKASVRAGQTMTILYSDDTPIGTGALAPTALLSNGQLLRVTVTPTSGQRPNYVNERHGSTSTRYQALLTFSLPATLAAGKYTITVTVHDTDGDTDQWVWAVTVGKQGDDKKNDDDDRGGNDRNKSSHGER